MPRYFFHLRFGQRVLPDEEGVELPNRSAAREEALAVVRDLANPEAGSNSRRWASWFLQVADNEGQFFRTPIGHPALEIVTPDAQEPSGEQAELRPTRPTPTVAWQRAASTDRSSIVQQMSATNRHTAQLLEHNRRLREELSSLYLAAKTYGFAPAASWRAPALPQLTSRQDRRLPHRKPPAAAFACDLVPLRDG